MKALMSERLQKLLGTGKYIKPTLISEEDFMHSRNIPNDTPKQTPNGQFQAGYTILKNHEEIMNNQGSLINFLVLATNELKGRVERLEQVINDMNQPTSIIGETIE